MIAILFLCAIALSSVAAFYSIMGMMAIFAAAPIPIAIMGSILEVSKLVVASWLYRNWKPIPKMMKAYLSSALVVIMLLTSMGIFGFLSKAHLDQGMPSSDLALQVELIDQKISIQRENIDAARRTLSQLDQQINKYSELGAVTKGVDARKAQQQERVGLIKEIEVAQSELTTLNETRTVQSSELRKVEIEVGPIKYIAAVIYGDNPDANLLERAVRWVIMLIVVVFDPLAVVMLVAANWSLVNSRKTPFDEGAWKTPYQWPVDIHGGDPNQPSITTTDTEPTWIKMEPDMGPTIVPTVFTGPPSQEFNCPPYGIPSIAPKPNLAPEPDYPKLNLRSWYTRLGIPYPKK